jgi:hypothetical protein
MRVWWATLAFACSQPAPSTKPPPPVTDAGADVAPLDFGIGVQGLGPFYVVRGESTQIPFFLTGHDAWRVTAVSAVGLPAGVTATPTMRIDGGLAGTVTLTASSDAMLGDVTASLITQQGGASPFRIGVVGVDGSLDPTFGTGGIVELQKNVGIVGFAASGGKIWVAGTHSDQTGQHVYLARFLETGALDATFGIGGEVEWAVTKKTYGTDAEAFAVCADGSVVVAAEAMVPSPDGGLATEEDHAVFFDASGALTADVLVPVSARQGGLACVDGAALIGVYQQLVVVDASHVVHTMPLPTMYYFEQLASSPPDVYVVSSEVAALVQSVPSTYVLDSAFGDAGVAFPPDTATRVTIDQARNLVFGLDVKPPAVARMQPTGAMDIGFGDGGVAPVGVGSLIGPYVGGVATGPTSNDVFAAVGSSGAGFALVRLDSSGQPVTTFGDLGVSFKSTTEQDIPEAVAFDSANRLWMLVSRYGGSSFLARYRIFAP